MYVSRPSSNAARCEIGHPRGCVRSFRYGAFSVAAVPSWATAALSKAYAPALSTTSTEQGSAAPDSPTTESVQRDQFYDDEEGRP